MQPRNPTRPQDPRIRRTALRSAMLIAPFCLLPAGAAAQAGAAVTGEERAVLVAAPNVPPPITRRHATKVIVELEAREIVHDIAPGVQYAAWTFGGSVPGPFLRVREGDLVELQLHNHPRNRMSHSIDVHALTGTAGGAEATLTAPGSTSMISFTARNPGLYVYHCAAEPLDRHISSGMHGLILVEPAVGLPRVDREFYVMQSEFYTQGRHGEGGMQAYDPEKALDERPDYVVFNGSVGALMDANALQAAVGETVRIYVGNAGPNLVSSFRVVGEIFDRVHGEGGIKVNQEHSQATLVPAGGSAMVEFRLDAPGSYRLVDHSASRSARKGAAAVLQVTGEPNLAVFSGRQGEFPYQPEGWESMPMAVVQETTTFAAARATAAPAPAASARTTASAPAASAPRTTTQAPAATAPRTTTTAPAASAPRNTASTPAASTPRPAASAPAASAPASSAPSRAQLMQRGAAVYRQQCAACHQANGAGVPGTFPPLARSDYLMANKTRSIDIVLKGLSGPITVNGVRYNGVMPPMRHLNDMDIASVLTYVRNSFGNSGAPVTPDEVKARR